MEGSTASGERLKTSGGTCKNPKRLPAVQRQMICNEAEAAGTGQDRNEDIRPNDRVHNVNHMSQAWKGGGRKWYSK